VWWNWKRLLRGKFLRRRECCKEGDGWRELLKKGEDKPHPREAHKEREIMIRCRLR
jgi:hypothetical protein